MRWKAIYIIISLLFLVGIIGFFCTDLILQWSIERSLETAVGVKVEARPVHLDFFKLTLTIGDLQITNPNNTWRNLIQAKKIRFQLDATPLYSGKMVINEINIEDVMLNSPRETDGRIKRFILPGPLGEAQKKLNRDIASVPVLNPQSLEGNLDTGKLFASYKFKTTFSAELVQSKIDHTNQTWQENLKQLEQTKTQIADLQKSLAEFQKNKPKNLADIQQSLAALKDLNKTAATIETTLNQTTNGYKTAFTQLGTDITGLKNTAEEDYRSLLGLAKLPNVGSTNYTEALLGKELLNESTLFIRVADQIQKAIPFKIENPPKEKHPRGGQEIIFPGRQTYPRLLIKHIAISGRGTPGTSFDGYFAKGSVEGVTSEPMLYGRPMLAAVYGEAANHSFVDIQGRMDYLTASYDNRFDINVGNLPLPVIVLPDSQYLPDKITSGLAEIRSNVRIKPDYFALDLTISGRNLSGQYAGPADPKDIMAGIIRDALSRIDDLQIHYQLETIGKNLTMRLSSNIDKLIAARLQTVIGEKINKFTGEIRAKVDAELKAKEQQLETARAKYQQQIQTQVDTVRAQFDKQKQILDAKQKEIEAKKKELEGQLIPDKNKLKLPNLKLP